MELLILGDIDRNNNGLDIIEHRYNIIRNKHDLKHITRKEDKEHVQHRR